MVFCKACGGEIPQTISCFGREYEPGTPVYDGSIYGAGFCSDKCYKSEHKGFVTQMGLELERVAERDMEILEARMNPEKMRYFGMT